MGLIRRTVFGTQLPDHLREALAAAPFRARGNVQGNGSSQGADALAREAFLERGRNQRADAVQQGFREQRDHDLKRHEVEAFQRAVEKQKDREAHAAFEALRGMDRKASLDLQARGLAAGENRRISADEERLRRERAKVEGEFAKRNAADEKAAYKEGPTPGPVPAARDNFASALREARKSGNPQAVSDAIRNALGDHEVGKNRFALRGVLDAADRPRYGGGSASIAREADLMGAPEQSFFSGAAEAAPRSMAPVVSAYSSGTDELGMLYENAKSLGRTFKSKGLLGMFGTSPTSFIRDPLGAARGAMATNPGTLWGQGMRERGEEGLREANRGGSNQSAALLAGAEEAYNRGDPQFLRAMLAAAERSNYASMSPEAQAEVDEIRRLLMEMTQGR